MNYYQNLNVNDMPESVHEQLNNTLGRTKSRFVRGDSYTQSKELYDSTASLRNDGLGLANNANKKKEDFLDRFIQRQHNWQGYYKNNDKLETLKCDKRPEFLINSEFLPSNKENTSDFDTQDFANMKKSKMLPNSVIVDQNFKQKAVDKQWAKNYSGLLENQKVFKDVNYMELGGYNKLSRKLEHPYINTSTTPVVDLTLKKTIMSLYKH